MNIIIGISSAMASPPTEYLGVQSCDGCVGQVLKSGLCGELLLPGGPSCHLDRVDVGLMRLMGSSLLQVVTQLENKICLML